MISERGGGKDGGAKQTELKDERPISDGGLCHSSSI